jgi:hypothetical protein
VTDTTNESRAPEREKPGRRVRDWPALAGIAFGPLLVFASVIEPASPYQAPLQEWVDWATDRGNGQKSLISVYFFVLASLAFVIFAGGLARRVRTVRGSGSLASIHVYGFGLMVAVLVAASGLVLNTGPIAYFLDGGGGDIPDPTDIIFFEQINSIGVLLLTVALALAFAAFVAVVSVSLRDTMPKWFTIISYATAVILLASIVLLPIVLMPIWPLMTSIVLLRRPVTN